DAGNNVGTQRQRDQALNDNLLDQQADQFGSGRSQPTQRGYLSQQAGRRPANRPDPGERPIPGEVPGTTPQPGIGSDRQDYVGTRPDAMSTQDQFDHRRFNNQDFDNRRYNERLDDHRDETDRFGNRRFNDD